MSTPVTAQYTALFAVYRVPAATGELLVAMDVDAPKQGINIYRQPEETIYELPAEPGVGGADR